MAVSQFPPKSSSSVFYVDATATNTVYAQNLNLSAAIYTVSCISSSTAIVDFWASDNSLITSVTTVSGTTTANLTGPCSRITYRVTSGTNVRIAIQLTGSFVGSGTTGTLDTVTSSGTYTPAAPGIAKVVIIGGGAGGFNGGQSGQYGVVNGGAGGGSGYANILDMQLTGNAISVTLGAGGAAGGAGGTTTFTGFTAAGGSGSTGGSNGGAGGGIDVNGYPYGGGGGGANGSPGSGVSIALLSPYVVSTGGGGGFAANVNTTTSGGPGGGGGIYGGGGGGGSSAGNFTYSRGGGGGGGGVAGTSASGNLTGGTGGAGRVFILRWA